MRTSHALLGGAGLLVLAASVYSYALGALPGNNGTSGVINATVARLAPGCSQSMCHTGPTPSTVTVSVTPGVRTFPVNQTISMATSIAGGVMAPGKETWGGFLNEVTEGKFTAGSTSQIDTTGKFITHLFSFLGGRNWQYTYKAPANPGVIELYAAANTVNGDGTPDNDMWGFHGDPTGQVSVPVRLYANAPGNTHHGDGCAGSFGNYPVLGSKATPAVGNLAFGYEVWGAPVATFGVMFLGVDPNFHVPLDVIGITGCTLHVNPIVNLPITTSAGGTTMRGDGMAAIPFPIPNDPSLAGAVLKVQVALVDPLNGRRIALTLTNGLSTAIQ